MNRSSRPTKIPEPKAVSNTISTPNDSSSVNVRDTHGTIVRNLVLSESVGSFWNELGRKHKMTGGGGTTIEEVIKEFYCDKEGGDINYVIYIPGGRQNDQERKASDQVGISIFMYKRNILKISADHPYIGCDGTFNIVSSHSCDGFSYELSKIV